MAPQAAPSLAGVVHVRHRHTSHFTVVGNHLAQHRELSLVAIGIGVYVQSLPDGASVGIKDLTRRFREGEITIGRGLRELEQAGYLRRERVRTKEGRVATVTSWHERPGAGAVVDHSGGGTPPVALARRRRGRGKGAGPERSQSEPSGPGRSQPEPWGLERSRPAPSGPGRSQLEPPRLEQSQPAPSGMEPSQLEPSGLERSRPAPSGSEPSELGQRPDPEPSRLEQRLEWQPEPSRSDRLLQRQTEPAEPELSPSRPEPSPPERPPAPEPFPSPPPPPPPDSPAADLLAGLRRHDPRLLLSEKDVRELSPAVRAWLERGVGPRQIVRTLTAELPIGRISWPARLLRHRLTHWLPPALPTGPLEPLEPLEAPRDAPPGLAPWDAPDFGATQTGPSTPSAPLPLPLPLPLQTCDGCDRAVRAAHPTLCRDCREGAVLVGVDGEVDGVDGET
ncbi:hypothetical protein [Streptomyces mobaraensis]|uniref:hypothetical protein n=1 Tax=Streptomyces mobaraensis TaxID=35621 RepID=UPI0033E5DCFE